MEESVSMYNIWHNYKGPGVSLWSDIYCYQGPKTILLLNNHFLSYCLKFSVRYTFLVLY